MNQSSPKSIVVVDDTPDNLHLLADMLTEQGYRVRVAPNGERAIATIQKEQPDLILLDIIMPEMDGFDVCRYLKAEERLKDIPVIFISALSEVFDKVTAFAVGGADYITKPFQIEEVLARIQTHLSLEEMRQQMQAQNQQLQEQNHELESFAHTVAHDLKNPLSVLFNALDLVGQEVSQMNEETQSLVHMSIRTAHKMSSIIDELLLLASVRKQEVETEPVDMAATVSQALNRLSHMINQYGPEIVLPKAWPWVMGYAPWIEEVWVNYLSNGLKYGGQPPHLELTATLQNDGRVRFAVRDNGQGLDHEAQAMLFAEFTRLDKVRAEGNGLGLSIVRRIVEKLDGEFGVESAVGQGSEFYFTLPQSE